MGAGASPDLEGLSMRRTTQRFTNRHPCKKMCPNVHLAHFGPVLDKGFHRIADAATRRLGFRPFSGS
jgi:hypothetical protein